MLIPPDRNLHWSPPYTRKDVAENTLHFETQFLFQAIRLSRVSYAEAISTEFFTLTPSRSLLA